MKVAVDGYWLSRPARGMARFARMLIKSLGEDAILLDPAFRPAGKAWSWFARHHPTFPEWEQYHIPKLVRAAGAQYLLCPFNTGPLWLNSNISLILVVHDIIFMDKSIDASLLMSQNVGKYYRRVVVPATARRAKYIVTVSEYSKRAICHQFGIKTERVVVIPNAVSDTWFQTARSSDTEHPYIFTVTGEAPSKNLERLIEAFSLFCKSIKTHTLKVAGVRTSAQRHFEAFAEDRGITGRIEFLPYVDDGTLRKLYSQADAYVCASLAEGFGIPLLEAMASGVPVVCGNITSMPEVAGEAAWYCDPHDAASIARAMASPLLDRVSAQHKACLGVKRASLFREESALVRMRVLWRELDTSGIGLHSGGSRQ